MGWIGKAQNKIEKRIEKAQTCTKCGRGPRKWCDNCAPLKVDDPAWCGECRYVTHTTKDGRCTFCSYPK